MPYKVQLVYFRPTGKFLAIAETTSGREEIADIWKEIDDRRRLGRLPDLRPGTGRDLLVVIDVPDHPRRVLHLVMPPFLDDDDATPPRIPTGEMVPIVRVPLAELPRTSTRDVIRPSAASEADTVVTSSDDIITPVDHPNPRRRASRPPDDE